MRNDAIFGKGDATICGSANFIYNYLNTPVQIKNGWNVLDRKGKGKIFSTVKSEPCITNTSAMIQWSKPDEGWVKINTDAARPLRSYHQKPIW